MIGGLFGTQQSQWGNMQLGLPAAPPEPPEFAVVTGAALPHFVRANVTSRAVVIVNAPKIVAPNKPK